MVLFGAHFHFNFVVTLPCYNSTFIQRQAKLSHLQDKGLMGGDQIQDQNADLLNKSPPTRASTLIVQPEEAQIQVYVVLILMHQFSFCQCFVGK